MTRLTDAERARMGRRDIEAWIQCVESGEETLTDWQKDWLRRLMGVTEPSPATGGGGLEDIA